MTDKSTLEHIEVFLKSLLHNFKPYIVEEVYGEWLRSYGHTIHQAHIKRGVELARVDHQIEFLKEKIDKLEEELFALRRGGSGTTEGDNVLSNVQMVEKPDRQRY